MEISHVENKIPAVQRTMLFVSHQCNFLRLEISVNIPFTLDCINCYANLRVSTHTQQVERAQPKPHAYSETCAVCEMCKRKNVLNSSALAHSWEKEGFFTISKYAFPARLFPIAKHTQ